MATKRVCDYCGGGIPKLNLRIRCPDGFLGTAQFSGAVTYWRPHNAVDKDLGWKSVDACVPCLITLLEEAVEKEGA